MQTVTVAFNLRGTGEIVRTGHYSPGTSHVIHFDDTGIAVERTGVGRYLISGPSIALPEGWRVAVYRDENDDPTVRVSLEVSPDGIHLLTTEPGVGTAKDIVHVLTVRVAVTLDLLDPSPALGSPGPAEVAS